MNVPLKDSGDDTDFGKALPSTSSRCGTWCPLWCVMICFGISNVLLLLTFPDTAAAYFNAGKDPCVGPDKDATLCEAILKKTTSITTAFRLVSSLVTFFSGPLVGVAADRYGRKPLFAVCFLCNFLNILALSGTAWFNTSLYWYYLTVELVGLVNPQIPFQLYIADNAHPSERAEYLGIALALFTLDGIVSPIAIMLLSLKGRLLAANVFGLLALILSLFCIKESRPLRQTADIGSDQGMNQVLNVFRRLMAKRTLRLVVILFTVGQSSLYGVISITLFYYKQRFGLNAKTMAPYQAVSMVSIAFANMVVLKPMNKHFDMKFNTIFSFSFGALCCIGYIIVPDTTFLFIPVALGGFSNWSGPIITALWSNIADKEGAEFGVSLGSFMSLTGLSLVVGPLVYNFVYYTFQPYASSPWVLATIINFVCLIVVSQISQSDLPKTAELDRQVSPW